MARCMTIDLADTDPERLSNWRHPCLGARRRPAAAPVWATPSVLRHTAASISAQSGVPLAAAVASLGHDPAIFWRAYVRLFPGAIGAVADTDDARTAVIDVDKRSRGNPSDLAFRVGLPGFEPGTS
jgi:hypothetical protein